jgi:3-dehydroquinate synthase
MEDIRVGDVTEVLVGAGLPTSLLPQREGRQKVAIFTQPAASSRAGEIAALIGIEGLQTEIVALPDREEAKTLAVAESAYETLARFGLTRHDTVVGVGGGSVTDLAGYVAGTWLRGVEVVHFPTTLLASVDASIGGKTGVNLAGKNLVGVIWHPTRVVVDTHLLEGLPLSLRREGMAEIFKAGLVGDSHICDLLAVQPMEAPLEEIVTRAIRVKAGVVGRDDRERGERIFLNFGHTIGHAIEFASTLSHGESVSVGMVAAAHISRARLGFSETEMVVSTLDALGLPTSIGGLDTNRIRDLLGHDKKRDSRGLRMVLLKAVEQPAVVHVGAEDLSIGLAAVGM